MDWFYVTIQISDLEKLEELPLYHLFSHVAVV